jgi:hypothetical protein
MNPRDRRLRQLRLSCQRDEDARRGRVLLEDALRTASLGDEGRLLVIRSLALGPLSANAGAQAWSQRLEQRVRALAASAVPVTDLAAPQAPAIWFADAAAPWIALALRAARGIPSPEWYWPAAAPGWTPQQTHVETLCLAFRELARSGGLPATFPLAQRLVNEGSLIPLLDALTPEDLTELLPESPPVPALNPLPTPAAGTSTPAGLASLPEPWPAAIRQGAARVGLADRRLVWLVTAAWSVARPTPPPPAALRLALERTWAELASSPSPASTATLTPPQAQPDRPATLPTDSVPSRLPIPSPTDPPALPEQPPVPEELDRDPAPSEGVVTALGGLFFLLPIFARLGVTDLPDPGASAWRALTLAWQRYATRPDDPLGAWFVETSPWEPEPFVLPRLLAGTTRPLRLARGQPGWRILLDPTGRLPLAAWRKRAAPRDILGTRMLGVRRIGAFPASVDPAAAALLLGAHRWCRRHCGFGLKGLLRRPAFVTFTPTHLDVYFRPGEADVRIRRAALDVNPGWLPWLGRVVAFHYQRPDEP